MKAVSLSGLVTSALLLVLALVGDADRWPAPESPPRQGEAMDVGAWASGHSLHSPGALGRLVREPQNTWSNLAFVLVGAFLVTTPRSGRGRLVGIGLIAVGVGSFLYHASASRTLRHLDVGAMYGLYAAMTLVAIASAWPRFRLVLETRIVAAGCFACAFGVLATLGRNIVVFGEKPLALSLVTGVTATGFIAALGLRVVRTFSTSLAVRAGSAVLAFALALACQLGDRPGGWFFNPEALVQAHAAWHVLSALAVGLSVPCFEGEADPGDR